MIKSSYIFNSIFTYNFLQERTIIMAIFDIDRINQELLNEGSINIQKNPIDIKRVLSILVHTSEGNDIPHFHIVRNDMNDCCIMLDDNRFFDHGNNDTLLNAKECRALEDWMKSKNKSKPGMNNWTVLALMWNDIPNVRIKVNLSKIPDYSTIKPYK